MDRVEITTLVALLTICFTGLAVLSDPWWVAPLSALAGGILGTVILLGALALWDRLNGY